MSSITTTSARCGSREDEHHRNRPHPWVLRRFDQNKARRVKLQVRLQSWRQARTQNSKVAYTRVMCRRSARLRRRLSPLKASSPSRPTPARARKLLRNSSCRPPSRRPIPRTPGMNPARVNRRRRTPHTNEPPRKMDFTVTKPRHPNRRIRRPPAQSLARPPSTPPSSPRRSRRRHHSQ